MKQKILEALKTKFNGVDEKVLNRIAEKLAKTVTTEEGVQPAVDATTFQQIIDGEADRRATEATQSAVTNYEKKHGLKDGQKVDAGDAPKDEPIKPITEASGERTLEAIPATINAANKPLLDRIAAIETGKVSETRKQKLDAIIGKLPDNLRKPYGRIDLTAMKGEDFDTFLTETTQEVEAVLNDNETRGAVLQLPGGNKFSKKEPTKEETDEVLKGLIN